MSQDGFLDFSMGEGDENVGKRSKRFQAETGRTYRVSFVAFSKYDEATGLPTEDALIRYAGCDRIYLKGVGNILVDVGNAASMAEFGQFKQSVATVICVWPTDKDGEIDVASYQAGKNFMVQPWVFAADKYAVIKISNKKFSLRKTDLSLACSDGTYQKMTFSPENESLLLKYLGSDKPQYVTIAKKIIADARALIPTLNGELATRFTVQQIRDKLGGVAPNVGGNAGGGHAAADVDDLLKNIV